MKIAVTDAAFQPWHALEAYEQSEVRSAHGSGFGATAVFVGTMRDFNIGDDVAGMTLEHYPGMTERYLEKIALAAAERWSLLDALVIHRVGELLPGEPIVLVAVWTAHRREAFEASRYIMEELKSKAPFWKKEKLADGSRWVDNNTDGY